jgi:hypothetical protein
MPTPTYTPLATVTLGSSAASVTFSSIPATYRDLILVSSIRSASGATITTVGFRLNGDTGSNYSYVFMQGTGSSTGSGSGTLTSGIAAQAENSTLSSFAVSVANFMDYSATDKHKTVLTRANSPSANTQAWASRWANTAAVTSIVLVPDFSFVAGSTFNLYGVMA